MHTALFTAQGLSLHNTKEKHCIEGSGAGLFKLYSLRHQIEIKDDVNSQTIYQSGKASLIKY